MMYERVTHDGISQAWVLSRSYTATAKCRGRTSQSVGSEITGHVRAGLWTKNLLAPCEAGPL